MINRKNIIVLSTGIFSLFPFFFQNSFAQTPNDSLSPLVTVTPTIMPLDTFIPSPLFFQAQGATPVLNPTNTPASLLTATMTSQATKISTVTPTPTLTSIPTAIPTPTNSVTLTPTPVTFTVPSWSIKSIDVMKYTKDVVCNQPTQATINTMVQKAVDLGANYVAISTPYEQVICGDGTIGDSLALTTTWVNAIRSHGLHVWHRHPSITFEGLYSAPKQYNADSLTTISQYITNNPTLFQPGDIFTPEPEPDSAGIHGVTYCGGGKCQFENTSDFNQWLRNVVLVSNLSFKTIKVTGVNVGYFGTSGFIVYGENNPDWLGKTFLEKTTVAAMGNVISMDDYPESYGGTMDASLQQVHSVWPNASIVIGEWGTTTATTSAIAVGQITASLESAAIRSFVTGFNYWNLGPSGNEGLLNADFTVNPSFTALSHFFGK